MTDMNSAYLRAIRRIAELEKENEVLKAEVSKLKSDKENNKYTQRQWDREVGWGKVPKEYREEEKPIHPSWVRPMHPYFRKQLGSNA